MIFMRWRPLVGVIPRQKRKKQSKEIKSRKQGTKTKDNNNKQTANNTAGVS